jgi:SAM-dependent methyltransferase
MFDLEFTGERIVPGKVDPELVTEHQSRYHFAADFVRGREVADFGCGTGYGSQILRDRGARRMVGIDCAPEAIRYARARFGGPGVDFLVADSLCTPFGPERFDVVVCFEVIEHVRDYRRFLREVRRTLRPEGLLLLSTPNKETYRDGPGVPPNPFHVHEFELDELRRELGGLFPAVAIFGQSRTEGAYFYPEFYPERPAGEASDGGLVTLVGTGAPPGDRRLETADYFLALCAAEPAALTDRGAAESFYVAEDNGVRTRNRRIVELQDELDARTRWAQQLQAEAERTGDRAGKLQARLVEAERIAAELAREAESRAVRILALEQRVEKYDRTSRRLDELEAKLSHRIDETIGTAEAGLAEARKAVERLFERGRERDALVRWHRDTLVLQQAGQERLSAEVAAQRNEQSRLAGELDRISTALDGHVQRLSERTDRQDHAIDGLAEQVRRVERLAERARELIDMLWGSRSWRLYAGLTRILGAARLRRARSSPAQGAGGAEAESRERSR